MNPAKKWMVCLFLFNSLTALPLTLRAQAPGTILTVAGKTPPPEIPGDGGPATQARLIQPQDVLIDNSGNLYIADTFQHRIRKVDPSGTITTFAGDGFLDVPNDINLREGRFTGDDGPATMASLNFPTGMLMDAAGNLYIADSVNQRVRKVDTNGVITTFAGNGAIDPSAPTPRGFFTGDGGPATQAGLSGPNAIAVDATGNIYIADALNHRIRKVDTTGIITTVAGSGPVGEAGIFSGDGGPATQARLNEPYSVTIDDEGNLYISDTENHRIRKVDTAGIISTFAGTGNPADAVGDGGPATGARLRAPFIARFDQDGNLYIPDFDDDRVRKVDTSGDITTIAGTGTRGFTVDGTPATLANLAGPNGVFVDQNGDIYIALELNLRIRKVIRPEEPTGIEDESVAAAPSARPASLALRQNYPNPFNPATTIQFALPVSTTVTLRIYNLLGQEVATLLDATTKPAGMHGIRWDGHSRTGLPVASGVYLYRLTTETGFSETRRMTLVK